MPWFWIFIGAVSTEFLEVVSELSFRTPAQYGLLSRTSNLKEKLPDQTAVVEVRWSWFWEGKSLTHGGEYDSEVLFILAVKNFCNLWFFIL